MLPVLQPPTTTHTHRERERERESSDQTTVARPRFQQPPGSNSSSNDNSNKGGQKLGPGLAFFGLASGSKNGADFLDCRMPESHP